MEVMVQGLPVLFDAAGVFPDKLCSELLHHSPDAPGAGGRLSPADDTLVGLDLDEHVVSRA